MSKWGLLVMCKGNSSSRNGFTLIELSIVIVIVGFLVAGISVGSEMIEQSKLRAVISDFNKYQVTILNFKSRYGSLPGDMFNAADYFSSCAQTQSNCNGGGDDKINYHAPVGFSEGGNESVKLFRHLYLAGMITEAGTISIPDSYSNHNSNASSGYFPLSRMPGSSYVIVSSNFNPASTTPRHYCYNGVFFFPPWTPQENTTAIYITQTHNDGQIATNCGGGITTSAGHQIDKKVDDGSESAGLLTGAVTGNVRGANSATGTCVTSNAYNISVTSKACTLGFKLQ